MGLLKKLIPPLILTLIATVILTTPLSATTNPMGFLYQRYQVNVEVESIAEALAIMATMPGIETSSSINVARGTGLATRVVSNDQLAPLLHTLSQMGIVTNSQSQSENLFARHQALAAEILLRQREYNRLMELLYDAETLRDFQTIERRLVDVIDHIERLRGQHLFVESQMGQAEVRIAIRESRLPLEDGDEPAREPHPFITTITQSTQNTLLFLARTAVPFTVFVLVFLVLRKLTKGLREQLKENRRKRAEARPAKANPAMRKFPSLLPSLPPLPPAKHIPKNMQEKNMPDENIPNENTPEKEGDNNETI